MVLPSSIALLGPLIPPLESTLGPSLRPGIDFTGGTAMTIEFAERVSTERVREQVESVGHTGSIVQSMGGNSFFIRLGELEGEILDSQGAIVDPGGRRQLEDAHGNLSYLRELSKVAA